MIAVKQGSTRTVLLVGRWAIKVPAVYRGGAAWGLTRGWQANLSELEQRGVPGRIPVRWSLFGLVSVYPRAAPVGPLSEADYAAIPGPAIDTRNANPANVGRWRGALWWVDYDTSWAECHTCRRYAPTPA